MNEAFASLLGERLREARKALGLKQDELAQAAEVSREQWGKYERGLATPGSDVLAAVARAGVDVRYVLTGSRSYTPPPPLSSEERDLLERWRAASRETRNAAMGALGAAQGVTRTKQVFLGPVGGVAQGNATVGGVVIHQSGAPYRVTPKTAPKKAPK
jgi:transcriptional regulator with XRE-family HTH domain